MKHLIVYQITWNIKGDRYKFANFQYTTAINVKTRTRLYFMKDSYFL